jgi:hypothetical protein
VSDIGLRLIQFALPGAVAAAIRLKLAMALSDCGSAASSSRSAASDRSSGRLSPLE